jgi:hypothetical protein
LCFVKAKTAPAAFNTSMFMLMLILAVLTVLGLAGWLLLLFLAQD